MKYVDGFVLPVPKKKLKAYARLASMAGKIWKEHGAIEYLECAGDDLKVHCGIGFPKTIKLKPNETVIFAWIVYKSRRDRDTCHAKVMKDKRLADMMDPKKMPFDGKRLIFGGFKVTIDM